MSTHTIQVTEVLETHNCPSCGLLYGAPQEFFVKRREDGARFFCPNGHGISYADNDLAAPQIAYRKRADLAKLAPIRPMED